MKHNNRLVVKISAILTLIALTIIFGAKSAESQPSAVRVIKTISNTSVATVQTHQYYGSDPRQILDAYIHDVPVTGGRPWVVIYHGGSWENATKDTYSAANMAQRWFDEGFNVFNAEYTTPFDYAGNVTGKPWPQMRIDTALAVNYIKANAAAFNINPDKGGAYGFSAGGHLAALYATYYNGVKAVMTVSAPLQPHRLRDVTRNGIWGQDEATPAMHDLVSYVYKILCPRPDWSGCGAVWDTFKPETYLSSTRPDHYIIQGMDDPVVPSATGAAYDYWVRAAGVHSTLVEAAGYGHTDAMIGAGTPGWATAVAWMKAHAQ